jgi:hypothetical protein
LQRLYIPVINFFQFVENKSFKGIIFKIKFPIKNKNKYNITDLLGSGYSSFANSEERRERNILNGLSKIDGLLISPGETISLLNELTPFTTDNGYLDGLIISKGNIVPDVGGGICQVSTTLYRAAMNSGLKIVNRKNHSTWISWYNDIRNKNPGTDATLYNDDTGGGASLDLKFVNDTNNYILIKTKTDKKGNLNIEIWGTKDGRNGSYTAPEIEEKIPATTTVTYILDEKKFFTEKKCSGPFEGAKTFFFYNIKLPDGSTSSEKVASYYPPQVKSCLVDEKEIARLEKKLKDKKVSQAEKSLIKIVKN